MDALQDNPLVSVVIASYNMGVSLPLAVQSVLDQTYTNYEVIIIDDGSTDDTQAGLKPYLLDSRVKYFYQENKGQTVAKNKGISETKGHFIAFLDADDIWSPDKLEKQMPCFSLSPSIGVVYSNVGYIDEHGAGIDGWKINFHSGWVSGKLLIDNFVPFSSVVVRRECFEKVGLFDKRYRMGIDYDLWLRMSVHYEFYYLDAVTFQYRVWSGQMSHNYKKRFECAIAMMRSFIEQNPSLVHKHIVNEAWAHTYVSKGTCIARVEKNKIAALREYVRSLGYVPTYIPAWKGIVKLIVRR
jgi:glycosyltransferase involved in cell wall biosynthesis